MSLDRTDRNWLDTKFDSVHSRITDVEKELAGMKEAPCRDLASHIERDHPPRPIDSHGRPVERREAGSASAMKLILFTIAVASATVGFIEAIRMMSQ